MDERIPVTEIEYRWAKESEWAPSMKMIWRTFLRFEGKDYTAEGIEKFREFIFDDALYISFLEGKYRVMVALYNNEIVGAASLRDGNVLSLLFVEEGYQNCGIGRALLDKITEQVPFDNGLQRVTLMASPVAIGFYRKLGFRPMGPELCLSGMRITPMERIYIEKGE